MVALEIETPLRDRPQIHGEAEEWQQRIGLQPANIAFECRDIDRRELTIASLQAVQLIGDDEFDLVGLGKGLHARH